MPGTLVLIGGGGHALVVIDAARAAGLVLAGVLDDQAEPIACRGPGAVPRLGATADLPSALAGRSWIIAVGDTAARAALIDRCDVAASAPLLTPSDAPSDQPRAPHDQPDARPGPHVRIHGPCEPLVHPTAWVSPSAELGRGVFVGPMAVINARARIAHHAIINTGAVVEHECDVGLGAHVAPHATLAGGTRVGAHALVGLGAAVLPGAAVGARAVVGAGAVVLQDVAEGQRVAGCPARAIHPRASR